MHVLNVVHRHILYTYTQPRVLIFTPICILAHPRTHTPQQEQVLTELFHYANQSPPPHDAFSVISTRKYLEACNKIFENGFLCHKKIYSSDSEVLVNIQSGFSFFSKWINSLLEESRV